MGEIGKRGGYKPGKVKGRPRHDYSDKMLLLKIEGWARDGYDDQQIAELLSITPTTFSRIKNREEQVEQALTRGRRPLEVIVENSLFKRATGTKVKTVVKKWLILPDGTKTETQEVMETETEIPADVKAIDLWLRNRKPEHWNKQPSKIDHTTNGKELQLSPPVVNILYAKDSKDDEGDMETSKEV